MESKGRKMREKVKGREGKEGKEGGMREGERK